MKKLIAIIALSCLVSGVFAEPLSALSPAHVQNVHHPKKKKDHKPHNHHRRELKAER